MKNHQENLKNNEFISKTNNSRLNLENRKALSLHGVEDVFSSNENSLILKVSGSKVYITGTNISISKLDIENKILEATGLFNSIKFIEKQDGFFKRIFKWQ